MAVIIVQIPVLPIALVIAHTPVHRTALLVWIVGSQTLVAAINKFVQKTLFVEIHVHAAHFPARATLNLCNI